MQDYFFRHKILLLVFLLSLVIKPALSDAIFDEQPYFHKITIEDGLSQGSIFCLHQDQKGFIWIGTMDGLNRFDGYDMKVYRNILGDTNSIASNNIKAIFEDSKGNLWIGTSGGGLNMFDPVSGKFRRFYFKPPGNKPAGNIISAIAEDADGKLWVGTIGDGLFRFDPETKKYEAFFNDPGDAESLSGNKISSILIDSRQNVLIGTGSNGINLFIPETKKFKIYRHDPKNPNSLSNDYIKTIIESPDSTTILIGTYGGYLNSFDPETEKFSVFRYNLPDIPVNFPLVLSLEFSGNDSLWIGTDSGGLLLYVISKNVYKSFDAGMEDGKLSYNIVTSLLCDRDGNLWVGTNGKGINICDPDKKLFYSFSHGDNSILKLAFNSIRAIYKDEEENLWIGGYYGLEKIIPSKKEIFHFLPGQAIYSIYPDKNNKDILWLGSEGWGIIKFNIKTLNFTIEDFKFTYSENYLTGGRVFCFADDNDGNLYIGTGFGLNVLNLKTGKYKLYSNNPGHQSKIINGHVKTIFIDSPDNIWIGSDIGGLAMLNKNTNSIINYLNSVNNSSSLSSNSVNCIFKDSKNRFWIGTDHGLNLMNRKKGTFKRITETDGLPNNVIYGILEDKDGNLWLSTNKGLCKYNHEKNSFTVYDKNDGLPGNEFNKAAYFKSKNGIMYFGGVDGFVAFDPSEITDNTDLPEVAITGFYKADNKFRTDSVITFKRNLTLEPDDNIISFEFSAMNFINPDKCQYAYMLENFVDKWINLQNNRKATFTNLDPGKYVFKIKASNNDGIWNEEPTVINIVVLPYFYETLWFKILVVVIILGIFLTIFLIRINFIRRQEKKLKNLVGQKTGELKKSNKKLLAEIEERKKTEIQLETANATKDKFFSIIAHDLKNPFNSLMGFSDLLVEEWNDFNDKDRLSMIKGIQETSINTYKLLLNLLEWSGLQRGEIEFNPKKFDFKNLIDETQKQFQGEASIKNISINFNLDGKIFAYADFQMINTVLRNLVSNAIKFTPRNGNITVSAIKQNEMLQCCVKDTGIGMDHEEINSLFKIESTRRSNGTEGETGTGLGLILCKEFVDKNNGKIWVESEVNQGSSFYFSIPTG